MEWHNTAFKFKEIAELAKKELDDVGIKTDLYTAGDGYWYVGWKPIGREQYNEALKIITAHID